MTLQAMMPSAWTATATSALAHPVSTVQALRHPLSASGREMAPWRGPHRIPSRFPPAASRGRHRRWTAQSPCPALSQSNRVSTASCRGSITPLCWMPSMTQVGNTVTPAAAQVAVSGVLRPPGAHST